MGHFRAGCLASVLSLLAIAANGEGELPGGVVRVIISDHEMIVSLARALNVDASQIPLTVLVPVRVAARVCGLATEDVSALSDCDAMRAPPAFRRAVMRQLLEE